METRWFRLGAAGALALGAFLVVDPFGASSGAQSAPAVKIPHVGNDAAPAVSDDGSIVVFASTDAQGVRTIVGHDRLADVTTTIPGSIGGVAPAISGDGCTVAWTVPGDPGDEQIDPDPAPSTTLAPDDDGDTDPAVDAGTDPGVEAEPAALQAPSTPARLFVADRCAEPIVATEAISKQPVDEFGRPALSGDGTVLVASSGDAVLRFDRTANGHEETAAVAPPAEDPPLVITPEVDLSDDGAIVVFAAGADPTDPTSATVFRSTREAAVDTITPVAPNAHRPSVSGDGAIVAYVVVGADPGTSTVTVRDRAAVPVPIGPGDHPQVSVDGTQVVFETATAVQIGAWTGDGVDAFDTIDTATLGELTAPTATGPAIDRHGTTIATDIVPDDGVDADITLSTFGADASFGADTYRLGAGDIGAELDTTVTFTNNGPASLGVASVAVDGTFTVVSENCTPVVRPGATCSIEIGFTVEFLEESFGTVTLTPAGAVSEPASFTTEVRAVGQAPPVEPPTSTSPTTTPPSSTGGTTGGTTTTSGRTTTSSRTTSTTGGRTSSSTTGGRTATTTTTLPAGTVAFSPTTFDFAPTIVDDGRRTGLVEILNTTPEAVTIAGVRVDPADADFDVAETDCATLATNGLCRVTVGFSPTSTGDRSARVIASLSDGTEISATLTGVGAPPPTLTVFPGVASPGQVVTVQGAGFPTGLTVELSWSVDTLDVVVDDTGGFSIPVIVLPKTSRGPQTAAVTGQADQFGDVTATMLVTSTTNGAQPSVLDGIGPNIGR